MKIYLFVISIVITVSGLWASKENLPYLGDILWAMLIVICFRFILSKIEISTLFLLSFGFCVLIEITQLFHYNWLLMLRSTFLVYLLGHGTFSIIDIGCYFLGVCCSILLIFITKRRIS